MKAMKYLFAGALVLSMSATAMAQDVQSQIDAISKVVISNKGDVNATKDAVKEYVKANKKNAVALAGLGRAFLDAKNQTEAMKYAEMAIKANKNSAAGHILKGDIAVANDNPGEAANRYQDAMTFDPKDPKGYIKYARIYQKVDPAGAEETLRKLAAIDANYPADAEIAHMYYSNNKFPKALENYQKVALDKLTDDKLTEYAMAAYFCTKSEESLKAAEYGAQKYKGKAGLNRLAFYNHTDLKNFEKALQYADELFNRSDSAKFTARDYLYYGHALRGAGKHAEAIENFNKTYTMDDSQKDVLKLMSDSYLDMKNHDKAVEYLQKFLDTKTEKRYTDFANMANIYMDLAEQAGEDKEAKDAALMKADKIYGDLAEAIPNYADYANYNRATINWMVNQDIKTSPAKQYYEKVVELVAPRTERSAAENKWLVTSYNFLMAHYIQTDNTAKAKEYAAKALEIDPENKTAKLIMDI